MISKASLMLLSTILMFFAVAANGAPLTDGQLAQIQFDQKVGAHVERNLIFKDENAKTVRLGDCTDNKPTVLILGYYGCPMLCTLVLNGAADCFRNMTWQAGRQFNVVFVSIDPDETPALALKKKISYVNSYGTNCAGSWHFLTGNENSISNLAAEVGFRYAYDAAAKQYAHPSGLVILGPGGNIAHYFFGINFAAREVDTALRNAAQNQTEPPESQFTLLCFHYSPIHGRYGNLIMKVVRGCGVLAVVFLAGVLLLPANRGKKEKGT